jgi:hypothetical protein
LTFLALYRVDVSHGVKLSHRQASSYEADATLFVTQPGFPWGRTVTPYLPGNAKTARHSVPVADETRLATLTALYAQLAMSDPVRHKLQGVDAGKTKLSVTPVPAPPYVNPAILPLLTVAAIAPTQAEAIELANTASARFDSWLARQQESAGIPVEQRVKLEIVDHALKAKLAGHRSKTLPGIIFLGLLAMTFGFIFVRENLNPRATTVARAAPAPEAEAPARLAS